MAATACSCVFRTRHDDDIDALLIEEFTVYDPFCIKHNSGDQQLAPFN